MYDDERNLIDEHYQAQPAAHETNEHLSVCVCGLCAALMSANDTSAVNDCRHCSTVLLLSDCTAQHTTSPQRIECFLFHPFSAAISMILTRFLYFFGI